MKMKKEEYEPDSPSVENAHNIECDLYDLCAVDCRLSCDFYKRCATYTFQIVKWGMSLVMRG
jgi:hypothetical protein